MRGILGQYIVADSEICHGKPTFIGTRILVTDIVEQVESGMAWEAIIDDGRGDVTKDAVEEAVRFTSRLTEGAESRQIRE